MFFQPALRCTTIASGLQLNRTMQPLDIDTSQSVALMFIPAAIQQQSFGNVSCPPTVDRPVSANVLKDKVAQNLDICLHSSL